MKTINRYNYEEFFLLYIDNELDAEQRKVVEQFVQENADLSVELNMLMQTRSLPEHEIIFTHKENLIRTEGDSIHEKNYEEYFLLYIDNELSASKRLEVETYILQRPQLQEHFTLLKQVVLPPEVISYSNKEELYRTERRRLIQFKPWRLVAAAAFIGACVIGWWALQKAPVVNTVAEVQRASKQLDQTSQPVKKANVEQPVEQPETAIQQTSSPTKDRKPIAIKNDFPGKKKQTDNVAATQVHEQILPPDVETVAHDIIKPDEQSVIAKNDLVIEPEESSQQESTEAPQNMGTNNGAYNIYPVAYKEINTNDDDRSVHVAMLDLNKNKVKSFLKKAGRIFSNKSNDLANEDGKLQVANFEIETNKQ